MSAKITWEQYRDKLINFSPELIISSKDSDQFNIAEAVVKLTCPYNNCGKQIVTNKPRDFWLKRTESCGCFRSQILKDINKSDRTFKDAREILSKARIELINGGKDNELISDVNIAGKYRFKCFCGKEFGETTNLNSLMSGNTTSCGHVRVELMKILGQSHTGIFTKAQREVADSFNSVSCKILNDKLSSFGSKVKNSFEGLISNRAIVECICRPKCGRVFYAPAGAIKRGFTFSCGCLKSLLEIQLYEFVHDIYPESLKNTRKIIKYYDNNVRELDIFIPSKSIAIELDGIKWHGEKNAVKMKRHIWSSYHKYLICKENGIRLITIFEDEWRDERDRIKDYLKSVFEGKEELKQPDSDGIIITENRLDDYTKYLSAGYKIIEECEPSFYYTFRGKRFDKDGGGYDRVWDCGKIKWGLDRPVGL